MDRSDDFINSALPLLAQGLAPTPIFTVCLLGFEPKEQVLFVSMFNLSKIRPIRYVEYDQYSHPYPDFYVVSTDSLDAVKKFSRIDRSTYGGALFVGNTTGRSELPILRKPIKWAEVLMRLDELPRSKISAQAQALLESGAITKKDLIPAPVLEPTWPTSIQAEPKSNEFAGPATILCQERVSAENALEVDNLNAWYDREKVLTFTTEAAVLIVDADISAQRYMTGKLVDLRYRVDFATSAKQAWKLFTQNRYNAVFTEINLPGLDGYDLCKQIKSRVDRRKSAVIFVTSKGSTFDRVKGSMAGCDAYLTKPVEQERLVEVLNKFLPNWRMKNSAD